ncbi:MAG: radical SAM protein [Nitrospirota bacterium]
MKIILVRPVTKKNLVLNVVPPIGLGYLASSLRKHNHEVKIIDSVKDVLTQDELVSRILAEKPQILGFQTFSHDAASVKKTISLIKERDNSIIMLAGGPHPSGVLDEIFMDIGNLDFAFAGEAEISLPIFIDAIQNGNLDSRLKEIPGLLWRDGERVVINEIELNPDLDSIPFPAWDLINPSTYPEAPQGVFFKRFPIAPLIVTRGCPYDCTFCAGKTVSGRRLRSRSVENVLQEIRVLTQDYGIKEIHILDDNFTLRREFVKEFCGRLLSEGFDITWNCPNGVRLDTLDEDVVGIMKESGCYTVSVGIESGSQRILDKMRKGLTLDKIKQQIGLLKKCGMTVNGFFIIGYPGETREEILETISFAKSLPLTRAIFYNYLPLPGTEAYKQLKESGGIERLDWDKVFQAEVPYSPRGITKEELNALQHKAHLEFYLRWGVFVDLLKEIKSFKQLKYIIRRVAAYLS